MSCPCRVVICLILLLALAQGAFAHSNVLYERQSPYHTIIVTEDSQGLRTLLFEKDGSRQSVVKVGDPAHIELPYIQAMLASLALIDEPDRILVVGLGGGTLPMFLRKYHPQATIDAVDIDPDVVEVAERFLGFQPDDRMRAHVADGRAFIEQCTHPYDLILLDAYGSHSIPSHLATREFLAATRKAVTPGGVVVSNLWGRGSNVLYDSMVRTYRDVFDSVQVLGVINSENVIVLALPRRQSIRQSDFARRAKVLSREKGFPFDLETIVRAGFRFEPAPGPGGRILRD